MSRSSEAYITRSSAIIFLGILGATLGAGFTASDNAIACLRPPQSMDPPSTFAHVQLKGDNILRSGHSGTIGTGSSGWLSWWKTGNTKTTITGTIEQNSSNPKFLTKCHPGDWIKVRQDLAAKKYGISILRPPRAVGPAFTQITDIQMVDEESPARLEWADIASNTLNIPLAGAYRPQESLGPFVLNAMVRAVNSSRAPFSGRKSSLTLVTGDNTDNAQENEVALYRDVLNGGSVDPDSGDPNFNPDAGLSWWQPGSGPGFAHCNPNNYPTNLYQGVKDGFYDPDGGNDHSSLLGVPNFPGLLEAANQPFIADGLNKDWFPAFGNHDAYMQGSFWQSYLIPTFSDYHDACGKEMGYSPTNTNEWVQPDAGRKEVSHQKWIDLHLADGKNHGFTQANSTNDIGYYTFKKRNIIRFIALDSVNLQHSTGINTANGIIDNTQFNWLEGVLNHADSHRELVVAYQHHSLGTMDSTSGQSTPHCGLISQGCSGKSLEQLFYEHPSVILDVNGHEHNNAIRAHKNMNGTGAFWEVNTASDADWPQQSRIFEIIDNRNDTLSIVTSMIDHRGTVDVSGGYYDLTNPLDLAGISRTVAWNDPQGPTGRGGNTGVDAHGRRIDRNVELLLKNPF